jgi:hypothetical protein
VNVDFKAKKLALFSILVKPSADPFLAHVEGFNTIVDGHGM